LQHFNAAEIPIAASEAAKNKIDGILEVWFSTSLVTLSYFLL